MKINNQYEILTPNGFVNFLGIQKLKKKTIEIFFHNGLSLRGSYNHQIYDYNNNPIFLKDIKINDKIKSQNDFLIVTDIKKYNHKTNVYDVINSGDDHVYFTNTIISHNCNFLGSGDSVISKEIQQNISSNMIREPIEKYMQGTFWQWKEPVHGHKYILGCLTPDEKVLTENGLMSVIDVSINNKLINENGEMVDVINKQIYNVIDEDIYTIDLDNTFRTTTFTKEHPILVSKPILKRNYLKNNDKYDINERYWDFEFKYTKAEDIEVNDWVKVPNIYKKAKNINLADKWNDNSNSPLNEEKFWWFIGMWLDLGYNQNDGKTISIRFNKSEQFYVEKMKDVIGELFQQKPVLIQQEDSFDMVFVSKELHEFLMINFGVISNEKKIIEWVKYLDYNKKVSLLKGYFNSNGCWTKVYKDSKIFSKISFINENLILLEGIQDILFSIGIISSLSRLKGSNKMIYNLSLANHDSMDLINCFNDFNDIKLQKYNISEFSIKNKRTISSCHLSKDKDWIYFKVKKINKSLYTGKVYNFECDTHTFMCHHITTHNCDVSRGDSEDFSSINIIDFDEREQVAEYVGKIPPDDLALIAYKWGTLYNAFIVTDITGGMGVATSRKLQELNYKNLYVEGTNTQNIWEVNNKGIEKIPGINFNNKRTQIVASFEEQLRKDFIIRSSRLLNELNTFVYINGRPDHMKGAHDDSIMSIAIAMYAGDISFNQLTKNDSLNKVMIDSWVMSERSYDPNKSFYSYGSTFDQINGMSMNESSFNQNVSKEIYKEYSWLFGKNKK